MNSTGVERRTRGYTGDTPSVAGGLYATCRRPDHGGLAREENRLPEICPLPRRLRPALDSIGPEYLDCFQSSFALFADQHRGPLAHVALGAHLIFPAIDALGAPRLVCGFDQRRDEAARYLGLRCGPAFTPVTPAELIDFADGIPDCYAVADAHETAWQPTFGHQHTPHSFALIVDPTEVVVVDAYANATPWGAAEPGAWRLSPEDVRAVVASGVVLREVRAADRYEAPCAAVTGDRVARAEASRPLFAPYADGLAEAARQGAGDLMVLDLWQLARDRRLHSEWLARRGVDNGREELDEAWRSLSTRAYVTQRRASPARAAPLHALAADPVRPPLAAPPPPQPARHRGDLADTEPDRGLRPGGAGIGARGGPGRPRHRA